MGKYLESQAKSHMVKHMPRMEKICLDLPKNVNYCLGRSLRILARISKPGGRAEKGIRQRSRVWGFSEVWFVGVWVFFFFKGKY